jgi:hypothetical protein
MIRIIIAAALLALSSVASAQNSGVEQPFGVNHIMRII